MQRLHSSGGPRVGAAPEGSSLDHPPAEHAILRVNEQQGDASSAKLERGTFYKRPQTCADIISFLSHVLAHLAAHHVSQRQQRDP